MVDKTHLVLHKQYPTYQGCFDIYPESVTTEEAFKKVYLIIIKWLIKRIGDDTVSHIPELEKFKDMDDYRKITSGDMFGFKLLNHTDIRLFNLEEDGSWAMRIIEPDNGAEFKSSAMNDEDRITGRTFITEVALKKMPDYIVLATQIVCKEPIDNTRDAVSFRPAFVRSIYCDRELTITEHGVNRQFAFLKDYDENGEVKGLPIVVNKANADDFVTFFLNNGSRQIPVIICPEKIYDITYSPYKYSEGVMRFEEGDIYTLTKSLMGYAYVVVVDDSVSRYIFLDTKLNCHEYGEELQENCLIIHRGFEEGSRLPKEPIYLSLTDIYDRPEEDDYADKDPLLIAKEEAQRYSVRKSFSFEPACFYRELKKEFYRREGNNSTEEAISNLEHDIAEKSLEISDLKSTISNIEKNYKSRTDELKSKFKQSQANLTSYVERVRELEEKDKFHENEIRQLKNEHSEEIRKLKLELAQYEDVDVPLPSGEVLSCFNKSNPVVLFDCDGKYKDDVIKRLIKDTLISAMKRLYVTLSNEGGKEVLGTECRRYHLTEILLQYDRFLNDRGFVLDGLMYYPPGMEFYDGEFKDVVFDQMLEKEGDDKTIEMLLDYNEYSTAQSDKKDRVYKKLNNYKQHSQIKTLLEGLGFVLKSHSNHYVYCYYGDERYKITVSGSPSDRNAGKNIADKIRILCL